MSEKKKQPAQTNNSSTSSSTENILEKLHEEACAQGQDFYIDPHSSRMVFTRLYHLKKQGCCQSGCRHCPYGFSKS